MNRPYVPISCDVHDELLALATFDRECELAYLNEERVPVSTRTRIVDVYSRGGVEYLRTREGAILRLDDLRAVNGRPVAPAG